MKAIDEINALKTDREKWQWLMYNNDKDHGLTVKLDNDDTFITDEDGE